MIKYYVNTDPHLLVVNFLKGPFNLASFYIKPYDFNFDGLWLGDVLSVNNSQTKPFNKLLTLRKELGINDSL